MFQQLTQEKYAFSYNSKEFQIYNKDLIEELLGINNQNPVNIASSTWKPIAKRNESEEQKASIKQNPRFMELKNLIEDHIEIDSKLIERPKEEIILLFSQNLKKFKRNGIFRNQCLSEIIENKKLKANIPLKYFYIVFSIYVMLKFDYFSIKEEDKLFPIKFETREMFQDKLMEILKNKYIEIDNLTSFCYRKYFWLDYRLSESLHSEIHTIIYEIFSDLESKTKTKGQNEEDEDSYEDNSSFKAEERTVADILGRVGKEYIVPEYQREYSWGEREIKSFLDDFFSNVMFYKGNKKYFLGNIVLKQIPEGYEIVDGQQRLTTILIMINVIRELSQDAGLKKLIDTYLVVEKEVDLKKNILPKISLTEINREKFTLYFADLKAEENRKSTDFNEKSFSGSNKLLFLAYQQILKYIKEKISEKENPLIELSKIKNALLESIKFIEIIAIKKREIYLIFETLNDRGMLLKTFEMIKNHIFGRGIDNDRVTLEILWKNIIKDYSPKNKLDKYLLPIYRSKYSDEYRLKEEDIFFHFRDKNKKVSRENYIEFTEDLREELYIYDNIMNPTEDFWGEKDFMKITTLNDLGVKGLYSIILSAKVKDFRFSKILDLCLNLAFKYKYGVKLPYAYNDLYHELSMIIRTEGTSYNDLLDKIEKSGVNKINLSQMKENFFNENTYEEKTTLAKSILIALNKFGNTNNTINWKRLTVEHILSKSGAQDNRIKEIEDAEGMHFNINNIYNLTLISKKDGEKCGNKELSEKVGYYKNYSIFTNEKLVKIQESHDEFTPQAFSEYKDFLWKRAKMVFSLGEFEKPEAVSPKNPIQSSSQSPIK